MSASSDNAFVTLLTSDHYLPGALVLAQSVRLAHGISKDDRSSSATGSARKRFDIVALITPDTLSVQTVKALRRSGLFDWIVGVEPIGFKQLLATPTADGDGGLEANDTLLKMERNLALLGRPDLQDTLTKLHVWRLGRDSAASLPGTATSASGRGIWQGYDKIVFLDADMLVLRPIDHLFSLRGDPNFAASPDTGWPDAFNSGLMLLKPSEATFESIRKFARERGSWDGADQGLLNDYFGAEADEDAPPSATEAAPGGGWKRLSFRYNVTSHGGYTFAPAYQRYGTSIMASHFIGQNKPWNRPRPVASADPNPHLAAADQPRGGQPTIGPSEPNYLLALWHDTCATIYPDSSLSVVPSAPGVIVVQRPAFTVPTYKAVWDVEAKLDKEREIEAAVHNEPVAAAPEAQYHSLPLDGRISLIAPRPRTPTPPPSPPTPKPRDFQQQQQPSQAGATDYAAAPAPSAPTEAPLRDMDSPDHFEPPQLTWDAAHAPPPTGQGEQFYQMRNPPDTYYQNVWDERARAPRSLAEQKAVFFQPPQNTSASRNGPEATGGPGYIPPRLKRDHVFDNLGSDRPDPSKIKPIFPWEQKRSAAPPTRVFPDEPKPPPPPPAPQGQQAASSSDSAAKKALLSFEASEGRSTSGTASPTLSTISASSSIRRGLPSNLAYTNAWDEENAIGKFAQWWTKASTRSEGKEVGVQATPAVRHRSAQTGTRAGMVNQGMSTADAGTSMYDTNAEGDAGAQSDSRDGDDESSSDGEDSDGGDNNNHRRTASGRSSGGDGYSSSRSRGGARRGYQKKAENSPVLQAFVTPRSPRTTSRFSNATLASDPRSSIDASGYPIGSQRAKYRIRPENWSGSSGGTPPKSASYARGTVGEQPSGYHRRRSQDGSGELYTRSGSGSGSGGSGTTSPTNLIGLRGTSAVAAPKIPTSSFSISRSYGVVGGGGSSGAGHHAPPPPIQTRTSGRNGSPSSRGLRTPTYHEFGPANAGGVDVPFSSSPVNSRAELDQQSRAHRNTYASRTGGQSFM
ncbi:related to glycogenin-2 beta [Pseudozyma flocculosa]|uniref:Related to glycogenin-2 beta n=2 Tax=Pseudozyma flocculosa TaxID=84751 RepID=A0A5C3F714_9BASI|nr:related to glycogenin-2 beta [Pseudozyma flocculosa]